ncbi:N-6 DNA methylase [Methanogenium organophilum]|uniref:site-specific DNA-methyltransferase (adenine-specific) n=1 Tax=Methanogenium organophilum TaxID=2199 RepID=A0A9X9S6H1_METOG|nr:N-6 DNA methylase [Methanogenium organophilum]WAI02308.1 N-6 DNA methylase [Methanogenium organophilum]
MALKKSELYSSIWKSCDELRGGMDASQYKDYVLVLLFVKYVSDKYAGQPDALIDIPQGGSFDDMVALKGSDDIGDQVNKIIGRLAEANNLKGVIDLADFNDTDKLGSGKEMVDRLSNLIATFQNPDLDFSRNRAEGDDLLGDAYEYLMRHFATESGKSKGQFYTPAEVSRVIAKVVGVNRAIRQDQTIYDPTCGSGSLLLKAADEAPQGITIYGQEKDNATAGLARMNMYLHDRPGAVIWKDNTLSKPHFKNTEGSLKTFDFVVANPPFSDKAWSNGLNTSEDLFKRFEDGVPPAKNGDYAYLLHILRSMKSTGKGAIILPHGVLFRGNAEGDIRRNLVRKGVIKGIIGLPANLFYGTGIPACIIVMDKENAIGRKGIFMIDASKGFMKDGNKNRLRHQDIRKIVDIFNSQTECERYSRMVPLTEIEANDYNLNIPRYIDSTEPEDLQDIEAHLKGGIPNRDIEGLAAYWELCPSLKDELFCAADRPGYSLLKVDANEIKRTIYTHPEFTTYTKSLRTLFDHWLENNHGTLKGIENGANPKELIQNLSEDLLTVFSEVPLIDTYDIYQYLMTYWADTMQDDVYLITSDGWTEANAVRKIVETKGQKSKEEADITIGKQKFKTDLIPPSLVIARYFRDEKVAVDELQADLEAASQAMEEMQEEHGGEDGLLSEVTNDKGKITKGDLKARIKKIKNDPDEEEERAVLEAYLSLMEQESNAKKAVKAAEETLDRNVLAKYPDLSEEEIKTLVVDDKWAATLCSDIKTELDRVSQKLTRRIKELADRYATPLPEITDEVEALSAKVDEHLKRMGFVW